MFILIVVKCCNDSKSIVVTTDEADNVYSADRWVVGRAARILSARTDAHGGCAGVALWLCHARGVRDLRRATPQLPSTRRRHLGHLLPQVWSVYNTPHLLYTLATRHADNPGSNPNPRALPLLCFGLHFKQHSLVVMFLPALGFTSPNFHPRVKLS